MMPQDHIIRRVESISFLLLRAVLTMAAHSRHNAINAMDELTTGAMLVYQRITDQLEGVKLSSVSAACDEAGAIMVQS